MNLQFFLWRSLKTRVTVLTLAIFVLGIWVLSLHTSRLLREDMQHMLGEQQFSSVSVMAHEINDRLSDRMQALNTIAKEVTPAMLGNPAVLQILLEQRPLLQLLFNGGAWVARANGTAIADVPKSARRIGVNYLDRDFISAALKDGKASVGRPVLGKQLQVPVVGMAVPIRDETGRVIGALVGVINLGEPNFLDQIDRGRYGKTGGYVLIAARHRLVVTATDRERIMGPLPAPGVNLWVDRFADGYEGSTVAINPKGVEVLVSGKGIPVAGWYLLATLPVTEAFAPIRDLQQRLFWTTVLLTLLAGGLIWWMLGLQLAPLLTTANAMVALSNTNQIPPPLAVLTEDEVGQLSASFNQLVDTWTNRETALRKSEENLSITLNSIGDSVITTDPAGQITGMNPAAERLCDWQLIDAMGRPLTEVFRIVNATTRESLTDPVQMVMSQGQVVGLANHTVLLAKGGQQYQIADSAAPIRSKAGDIIGVVLVFSDVTAKYQADLALHESEARWKFAIEGAGDGLWDWNIQTGEAFYSLRYKEMYGYSDADFGTSSDEWSKRLHPDDASAVMSALQPYLEGQPGAASVEFRMVCKDGSWRWTLGRGMVISRDTEGKPLRMIGTNTDITERKRAETAMRDSEARFRTVFEMTPDPIVLHRGGKVVLVNPAAVAVFAAQSDRDLIGRPVLDLIHPDFHAIVMARVIDSIENGVTSATLEERYVKLDGSYFDAEVQGRPIVLDGASAILATLHDITERKAHQSQLEHIAHFDALTGLPNRVLLADRLQQAMSQAQRRDQQVAVAYLDLDGFKVINDQHGHEAGDQVLVALAQRMNEALRQGDTLARLGGDEFVAVLIDLEDTSASAPLLNRLLAAAAQSVQIGVHSLQVSASLGVTFYPQSQDLDADQLLRQADQAMYQAKVAGKNRYQVFDAAQASSVRSHLESLERIRLALTQGELLLHYQPKVNMRSGQVIGVEALVRWQHPDRGLLAPATFLPVIEDHPLAVAVGEWVIDTALVQLELWRAAGLDLPVSVNVGARQLQQSDFVERLHVILAAHPQVSPTSLELEVLETSALADMAQVSQAIASCAQIGVKFALDDFGTGYSSLTYLKRLRVALLKIDQSFVRDMLDDPDDLAILQGVIGLAAAFKREVIAEGVETAAHGTLLLQLGCELAQGYGIAPPMPAELIPDWVATWHPDVAWSELPWLGA